VPASWLKRASRWRKLCVVLIVLVVLALLAPHAEAWYHLRSARSAFALYHPEIAQDHLARSLKVWPNSVSVHLLASRAARQNGDFEEAERQLRVGQRLVAGTSDEVVLEWALLQAAIGNTGEVDEFLQRRAEEDPELWPLVQEALVEGYITVYRVLDALACLEQWLKFQPDNLRALELRGAAWMAGRSKQKAADDFRRVLEQDGDRDATRWRLVACLLDMGSYSEALPQLEHLAHKKPDDPEVQVRLARCHNVIGNRDLARQLLAGVLERHPEHGLALRTRGHFALADNQPAEAEKWLRRAAKAWPTDYQTQWLLSQALAQQHKSREADEQLQIAQALKDRVERLGELRSRKMSEQPLEPALHYEMGVLLIRTGHKEVGERWLLSALQLDPNYRAAHQALADYYQGEGKTTLAEEHRRQSGPR
jgi:predicted Zn-dependent protease